MPTSWENMSIKIPFWAGPSKVAAATSKPGSCRKGLVTNPPLPSVHQPCRTPCFMSNCMHPREQGSAQAKPGPTSASSTMRISVCEDFLIRLPMIGHFKV